MQSICSLIFFLWLEILWSSPINHDLAVTRDYHKDEWCGQLKSLDIYLPLSMSLYINKHKVRLELHVATLGRYPCRPQSNWRRGRLGWACGVLYVYFTGRMWKARGWGILLAALLSFTASNGRLFDRWRKPFDLYI